MLDSFFTVWTQIHGYRSSLHDSYIILDCICQRLWSCGKVLLWKCNRYEVTPHQKVIHMELTSSIVRSLVDSQRSYHFFFHLSKWWGLTLWLSLPYLETNENNIISWLSLVNISWWNLVLIWRSQHIHLRARFWWELTSFCAWDG